MQKFIHSACYASLGLLIIAASHAVAREQINIVGSSTVYPFSTVVAEQFGKRTRFKTPKVESTGSGGGLKLFCEGVGENTPDIANASRRIKQKEIDKCHQNGVTDIIETKFGYDGIVVANAKTSPKISLSLKQIFLALAKEVPAPNGAEAFVANPYEKWSDMDASLPDTAIAVYGPPPTSGTRDAFVEIALEGGCKKFAWIKAIKKTDKRKYKEHCHTIREDGAYIEASENDNLIVHKLKANPNSFGIFGYSFLDQNTDSVKGAEVEGVAPEFEAIVDGSYPISRALYFYAKKAHIGLIPGIKEYLQEFVSDRASGDSGYLLDKGMIPLSEDGRRKQKEMVRSLAIVPAKI